MKQMECKVYKVVAEHEVELPDMDGIYYKDFEKFFEDMYSSKVYAIRKAQKLASKHVCYVRVSEIVISVNGVIGNRVVYRKFNKSI